MRRYYLFLFAFLCICNGTVLGVQKRVGLSVNKLAISVNQNIPLTTQTSYLGAKQEAAKIFKIDIRKIKSFSFRDKENRLVEINDQNQARQWFLNLKEIVDDPNKELVVTVE